MVCQPVAELSTSLCRRARAGLEQRTRQLQARLARQQQELAQIHGAEGEGSSSPAVAALQVMSISSPHGLEHACTLQVGSTYSPVLQHSARGCQEELASAEEALAAARDAHSARERAAAEQERAAASLEAELARAQAAVERLAAEVRALPMINLSYVVLVAHGHSRLSARAG